MNIDGFWLCPFVPAGCPGMGIVARAKQAFARFIFFVAQARQALENQQAGRQTGARACPFPITNARN